jgi:hypothetical protein
MKLDAWVRSLAIPVLSGLQALLFATSGAQAQEPRKPVEMTSKPVYVDLVKAMREDELYLLAYKASLAERKHSYNARCVANLKPAHLTKALAWTMTWSLSEQDAGEARAFFETDIGRKWTSRDVTRTEKKLNPDDPSLPVFSTDEMAVLDKFLKASTGEKLLRRRANPEKPVQDTVKAEMLERLDGCTETLAGMRPLTYCASASVPNPEKTCSARYHVASVVGSKTRETVVTFHCENLSMSGTPLSVPGQHETIGLVWHENLRLEILVPAGSKPKRSGLPNRYRGGPEFAHRERRPSDPPPAACVPLPPRDEFGWLVE